MSSGAVFQSPGKYLLICETWAFLTITPVSGFANCTVTADKNLAITKGIDHLLSNFAERCCTLELTG
jgi:hypothetical protein